MVVILFGVSVVVVVAKLVWFRISSAKWRAVFTSCDVTTIDKTKM